MALVVLKMRVLDKVTGAVGAVGMVVLSVSYELARGSFVSTNGELGASAKRNQEVSVTYQLSVSVSMVEAVEEE